MIEKYKDIDLIQQFFYQSLAKEVYDQDGIIAWYSGVNEESLNNVIFCNIDEDKVDESIQSVVSWYKQKNCPWIWVMNPFTKPQNLDSFLIKHNFKHVFNYETLIFKFDNSFDISSNKNHMIKKVTDMEAMTDWACILNEAFEAKDQNDMTYRDLNLKAPSDAFSHYILYRDAEPISTATLSISKHGTRIDNVATKNTHLRQGYASAIIMHLLNEAKNLNYQYCCLDVSDIALNMYLKLGFRKCHSNSAYGIEK